MKRTGRRKEGFTLIEVVVSIAILGLVSIPFCNSLMFGYRYATNADSLLNSHLEATSIVEELMADGISVTETTDDTGSSITSISVNDIVIDTSDTTYSGYTAEISYEDGSNTITCYNSSDQTYAYAASFDSTADYSKSSLSIYPCTYTYKDSDEEESEEESYDGICFLISDSTEGDTDVTDCTFIMNFKWEFTEVTYSEDKEGNTITVVEEDDDVLTLVFAPNFEYPAAEQDSSGSGSTGSDSTDEGPYWYDVAVSQGNVNINTSIRLADQDEDTEDAVISVTITDAGGNTTASGTYYASSNIFITSDSSTSYTVVKNDDGTVTLTGSEENSTTYSVGENDDGSQTWTAASS